MALGALIRSKTACDIKESALAARRLDVSNTQIMLTPNQFLNLIH
jgi:hypothetical protein